MSLLSGLAKRRQSATDKVMELARKEANGKENGSVEELAKALADSGYSEEQYKEIPGVHERAKKLKVAASGLDVTGKAVAEGREAIKQHEKETVELIKQRKQELFDLLRVQAESQANHRKAEVAKAELQKLEYLHPDVLGLEPHDLDQYTLTSGAGQNVLNPADLAAPKLEVPAQIWGREARRRAAIHQTATNRALSEYKAKAKAWASGKPRDRSGFVVSDETFPTFKPPTWAEIIKRGWNNSVALVA